jgi:hypothetical protein
MSTIAITDESTEDVMPCPVCGHEFTHHESTTVFVRDGGEDGPIRRIDVSIGGDTSIKSNSRDESPSERRDAVVVHFSCERGCVFDLEFSQHKGQTVAGHTILQRADETNG